jgi:hypothetical protein
MTITADQLAQAKAQIAAAKVAAVQTVITDLNTPTTPVSTLRTDVATALVALDTTDSIYQDMFSLSNILALTVNNLTTKLAPLQTAAASDPSGS